MFAIVTQMLEKATHLLVRMYVLAQFFETTGNSSLTNAV